jgi:hypothetical protein
MLSSRLMAVCKRVDRVMALYRSKGKGGLVTKQRAKSRKGLVAMHSRAIGDNTAF